MSFDTFVHWTQSVLGILTSIVTLIAGVLGLIKMWPVRDANTVRRRISFRLLIALILLIGLLILIVRLFSPRVAITEPADGGTVEVILHDDTGSAEFRVRGTATRLTSNSKRRIYLLVHPDEPPAPGWWIQPAVALDSTGSWTGVAWIGTRGWEAKPGQRLWLQAVVAARRDPLPTGNDGVARVDDPEELQPATTSKVVHATIRSVSRR